MSTETEYDRLFSTLFGGTTSTSNEYVIEKGKILIDLLGAKKENVSVDVIGSKINVVSKKKNIRGQNTKYEKYFILSQEYDPKTVSATYDDGILEITAELFETEKPRKVEIK